MNEAEPFKSRSEKEIFFEALDKNTPEGRAGFLDGACGKNTALRARVEALLADHFHEDAFMEKPAAAPREEPAKTIKLDMAASPKDEAVGQIIGRYKLLEKLGEGGCGAVYVAQQNEPVRRRVALKVIKLGMDTKEVIARFEAERQALAMMDHPNIAKVFDAGTTETGRPFFVMELVRGIKITDYCDQNQLNTKERLDLVIEVCHAVQHAHQKGIIHRDIKPSNIMVTLHDGVPVTKVIDFGIAKATEGRLTNETVYTQLHQFIGTPAYMSPEQAEMSGLDIDTRSDIYSLGVLLYELLAGSTPFDAKELMASGLDAMRKIIREQEPVRPSTRFLTLHGEDLTTTAKRRSTETSKLIHQLRGDLDWIVMKCLEKDRTRRYETANGLAFDILRHINNEPVLARPPSNLYRFQKMVRRNKLVCAAASAVAAALVIGLGLSTYLFVKEKAARQRAIAAEKTQNQLRQRAEAGEKTAETESGKSQQVARFLEEMLQGVAPSVASGRDTKMLQEILDRTAERVGKDLTNQPEVEIELRLILAKTYDELGAYNQEEEMARASLQLGRSRLGEEKLAVAHSLYQLGKAQWRLGKYDQADTNTLEALAMRRKLLGNENLAVADSLHVAAYVLIAQNKLPEAEAVIREVLAMRRKLLGNEHPDVASSLNNLANVLRGEGKLAEAETVFGEALAIRRKPPVNDQPAVARLLNNLAVVLQEQGRLAEAEPMFREALAMRMKLLGDEHPDTTASLHNLVDVLDRERKVDEAKGDLSGIVALLQTTLADQRSVLGEGSPAVVETLINLADHFRAQGKQTDADKALQEAVEASHKLLQQRPGSELPGTLDAVNDVVNSCYSVGRDKEVTSLAKQKCELNPKDTDASLHLAILQTWFGQGADYEATRRRLVQEAEGTDQAGTAERAAKAYCLRPSTNAVLLAKALSLARRSVELGKTNSYICWYQLCLGLAEYRNGHYGLAEGALATAEQTGGDHYELQGTARFFRALCLFQQNRPEEARKLFTQAETEMPPFPTDEQKPLVDGKPVFHEVLICWLSYKEAKALIEGDAKAGDHPK
jgi:serine/threonine protein kinase/tetratricopeptide (TPR) repeat protein